MIGIEMMEALLDYIDARVEEKHKEGEAQFLWDEDAPSVELRARLIEMVEWPNEH